MKTAIIYATKHGCTDKCAHTLSNELNTTCDIINIESANSFDIQEYNTVIIGGSIHAGMINKKLKSFLNKNSETLLDKKLGLFLCCMYEGDKALEQLNNAFPEPLRNKAIAHSIFGGEFDFNKMNFLEKTIVKKVANVEESVSKINYANIKAFAEKMKA